MSIDYYKNNPLKPIMFIGIILYKVTNNKFLMLLCKNTDGKYDIIHQINQIHQINNELTINDKIIERIYNATNYLILLNINDITNINLDEYFDDTTFTLIKFIKLPDKYLNLTSENFNLYEIITDDKKVKRELKWIDLNFLNTFILKNNKITQKLKNRDIVKKIHTIYKKITLDLTLKKISKYKLCK